MIGVAVIGAGHWGPNLIRDFHNLRTSHVVVVADSNDARLREVESRFGDIAVTTDSAKAIASDGVDAVVVATPTSTHGPLVREALSAGRHVLVEKPITASATEAEELCSLAEHQGVVLMVGHVFVYNAAVQRVKRYLADGELGRLYYLSMVRTNLGPIRMDVNAAWDLASHDISIANYWLEGQPLSVSAYGGTWINPGIEDAVFVTLRYPDDILANLHVSWLNPRKSRDITLVGERRMLTFDDMNLNEPLRIYDKGVTEERTIAPYVDTFAGFRASVREGDIVVPKVNAGEPLSTECDHFLQCIATGERPVTDGRAGLAVVRTLEAVERSVKAGGAEQPVT